MKGFFWGLAFALLAGFGLGLAYAWLVSPLRVADAGPAALRLDFKDQYRAGIAAAYAADGNLPRAEARLALMGDTNSVEALNSQAQRLIAAGDFTLADQVVALAVTLDGGTAPASDAPVAAASPSSLSPQPANTLPPTPEDLQFILTETPQTADQPIDATPVVLNTPIPRPTRTAIPTQGAPYGLVGQESICDSDLPDGLLQVFVFTPGRRQVPGMKIIITWEAGEDEFFTGFKPEISNGYADYVMSSNITYTVRLAAGSDIVTDLTPPACQTPSGEPFAGSIKLTFQQP